MEKDEEWNNFMHKVTEITTIVEGLTSEDKQASEKAFKMADKYLKEKSSIDTDKEIEMKLKYDRSMINKTVEEKKKPTNPNEMDPETFMKQVSIDAENRAADKKIRTEKAETLKTQASMAFKRGEYELALSRYDKAIDQIKDSCLLYTNRALTLLKLKQYEKVIHDCKWALRLNENSYKAKLYQTKAHQMLKQTKEYADCYGTLSQTYPQYKDVTDDFLKESAPTSDDDEQDDNVTLTMTI